MRKLNLEEINKLLQIAEISRERKIVHMAEELAALKSVLVESVAHVTFPTVPSVNDQWSCDTHFGGRLTHQGPLICPGCSTGAEHDLARLS